MMNTPEFSESHPLVLLLNELDILLTQARLMELQAKRAQALTGNRIAELKEEYARELAALRCDLEQSLKERTELRQALAVLNPRLQGEEQACDVDRATARDPEPLTALQGAGIAARAPGETSAEDHAEPGMERDAAGLESSDRERQWEARLAQMEGRLREAGQRIIEADTALQRAKQENTALHCRLAEFEVLEREAKRGREDEIEDLRHRIAMRERELTGRYEAVTAVELALHSKIQGLQQMLAGLHREIDERDRALEQAQGEAAKLRHDLERAVSARASAFTDASGRENGRLTIEQEERARVETKLAELRLSLAEKQLLADRRAAEIADLKDAVRRRHASRASEQMSHQEHFAMTTDEQNSKTVGPDADLENFGSQSVSEETLRNEILCLRREGRERNKILEDRNDELVRVKLQLDQLQERLAQLEAPVVRAGTDEADSERMRTEFQAQLALLQAELSQKQWALEERQAETRSLEQRLRQEIDTLRKQLAGHTADPLRVSGGYQNREPASAQAPIDCDENSGEASAGSFAAQRRWRRDLPRKRRWRSDR